MRSFGHLPELMGDSRAIITKHPVGRPLGVPGDADRQLRVVRAALDLLEKPEQTIVELDDPYRTG